MSENAAQAQSSAQGAAVATAAQGTASQEASEYESERGASEPRNEQPSVRTRIEATPGNPRGYPPFEITKVREYTNNQLKYYARTAAIPSAQLAAFKKAVKERNEINTLAGWSGDTTSEEELSDGPLEPAVRKQLREPLRQQQVELSFNNDDEPDSDYPEPIPGIKGIKVDERITKLKAVSDLDNFEEWKYDLRCAFEGDPNRYTRGSSRILTAIMYTEGELKSQHAEASKEYPLLRTHWRKFLRWVEHNVLYGDAQWATALKEYHNTYQKDDENPAQFYGRLRKRASAARRTLAPTEYFSRLNEALQGIMVRQNEGQWIQETTDTQKVVKRAQEIWGTLGPRARKSGSQQQPQSEPKKPKDQPKDRDQKADNRSNSNRRPQDQQKRQTRDSADKPKGSHSQRMSNNERKRRKDQNLCWRCGQPNHVKADCPNSYNPSYSKPETKPTEAQQPRTNATKKRSRNDTDSEAESPAKKSKNA
jgi:hypothetical protein